MSGGFFGTIPPYFFLIASSYIRQNLNEKTSIFKLQEQQFIVVFFQYAFCGSRKPAKREIQNLKTTSFSGDGMGFSVSSGSLDILASLCTTQVSNSCSSTKG